MEHFEINASTGRLRFRYAPNFEKPRDHDFNNKFGIVLRVSDGRAHQDQPVYIHLDDQNEAPVYFDAIAPLRVVENQPIGTIVGQLEAIDDDEEIWLPINYSRIVIQYRMSHLLWMKMVRYELRKFWI